MLTTAKIVCSYNYTTKYLQIPSVIGPTAKAVGLSVNSLQSHSVFDNILFFAKYDGTSHVILDILHLKKTKSRHLLEMLAKVLDFCKVQGKQHPLSAILGLAVVAMLCGYRSYPSSVSKPRSFRSGM